MPDDLTSADGTISLPKILAKLVEMETSLDYRLGEKADRGDVETTKALVHTLRGRVEDELARREVERTEAVEIIKSSKDNRTKIVLAVLAFVQAVLIAWLTLGAPVPG